METLDIFPAFIDQCGLDTAVAKLADHGLQTACFYAPADLIRTDAEAMAKARESFERGLECCAALKSPLLFTHGSQHAYAGGDNFARYRGRLAEMLEWVKTADVVLVVENARSLMHAAEPMAALDSPQFKLAPAMAALYLPMTGEPLADPHLSYLRCGAASRRRPVCRRPVRAFRSGGESPSAQRAPWRSPLQAGRSGARTAAARRSTPPPWHDARGGPAMPFT